MRKKSSLTLLGLGLLAVAFVSLDSIAGTSRDRLHVMLRNTGEDPDARGKLNVRVSEQRDRFRMNLRVKNLDVGDYDVVLDGVPTATITVAPDNDGTGTRGKLRARGPLSEIPFDPRGKALTIESGGTVFLENVVPDSGESLRLRVEHEVDLDNVGSSQPSATAEAEFRARNGQERFRVRLRSTEPGTYELLVGGASVGLFDVGAAGEGTIKFDTVPHSPPTDWRLLTFDPLGQNLEVVSGTETLFEGALPPRS